MHINWQWCLLFSITILLSVACNHRTVQTVFYQWDSQPDWGSPTLSYLDTLGTERLYLHFFDVEWDDSRKRAVPVGSLRLPLTELQGREIVPVVYLSENVLPQLNAEYLPQLVELVRDRLMRISTPNTQLAEIQFDSNWDVATATQYFAFIDSFQQALGANGPAVSVCIYPHHLAGVDSLGVPPVTRARLMLMEIDRPAEVDQNNSVLGPDMRNTISLAAEYGIPLDVALPIGSWGVVIRNQKAIALLRHLPLAALEDRDRFEVVNAYFYRVTQDTWLDGTFLFANDLIRLEALSPDQLRESIKPLAPYLRQDSMSVGFFHLDVNTVAEYPPREIRKLLDLFD